MDVELLFVPDILAALPDAVSRSLFSYRSPCINNVVLLRGRGLGGRKGKQNELLVKRNDRPTAFGISVSRRVRNAKVCK